MVFVAKKTCNFQNAYFLLFDHNAKVKIMQKFNIAWFLPIGFPDFVVGGGGAVSQHQMVVLHATHTVHFLQALHTVNLPQNHPLYAL